MSKISVFLALTLLSLVVSAPASAYYLVKMDGSSLTVYQGKVLGDEDSTEEKRDEQKPPEPKQPEQGRSQEVRKDSPTAGNRQNEIRGEINMVKKIEKREDQLEKKNQLNKAKKQVFIDPKNSTLNVNQLTPENNKRADDLKEKRLELQKDLETKGKKLTTKERLELQQKIKDNRGSEDRLRSTNLQKIEDKTLEIESEDKMKIRLEEKTEDRQRDSLPKRLEERRNEDERDDTPDENETESEDLESEIEIEKGPARVRTELPVGINAESGEMVIKTEEGDIVTPNTPDKVLERLRNQKVIDGFSSDDQGESTSEIVMEDDKPVYKIKGTRKARLFGFVPVNFEKEVEVDAETGEVTETNQSGFSKFFERFSL